MDFMIGDLPLHPLFVHLATVAVPVAALVGLVFALWPAARRRVGIMALVDVVLIGHAGAVAVWTE